MKPFLKSLLLVLFVGFVAMSCDDDMTYAEELKAEKELIADFIARNNIKVVKTLPPDSLPWPENTYYLSSSGLYFQLTDKGDTTVVEDTVELNDLIIPRFVQYTLGETSEIISNWNTIDYAYPTTFNYGDDTQVCDAWHEAVTYMKRNNSRAKIIVPSKLGFESDVNSVTPYGYDFKIKFQK